MKPKLKYGVVSNVVPTTGQSVRHGYLTGQPIYDSAGVVDYAIKAGYIRGKKFDLVGVLNGCLDAVRDLIMQGNIVDLDSWLLFYLSLTGQIGDDLKVTALNKLRMCIRSLKDMKVDISQFSFERVDDDGKRIQILDISSPNGKAGEAIKTKAIVANGRHLAFNPAWGDTVTVTWVEGEGESAETKTLNIVPSEQSASYLRFDWPTGLAEVPAGTVLTFSFRLHGAEGGAEQGLTKTATLVAAS